MLSCNKGQSPANAGDHCHEIEIASAIGCPVDPGSATMFVSFSLREEVRGRAVVAVNIEDGSLESWLASVWLVHFDPLPSE